MPYLAYTFREFDEKLFETLRFAVSMIKNFSEGAIVVRYSTDSPAIAAWLDPPNNCANRSEDAHRTGDDNDDESHDTGDDNDDEAYDSDDDDTIRHFSTESTRFIDPAPSQPPEPAEPHTADEAIAAATSHAMRSLADTEESQLASKAYYSTLAHDQLNGCVYAVDHGYGRCSDDLPAELVDWNRSNSPGAICFDLFLPDDPDGLIPDDQLIDGEHPRLRVYISVLCAKEPENKWCAHQAVNIFQQLLHTTDPDRVVAPDYMPNFDEITFCHIEN